MNFLINLSLMNPSLGLMKDDHLIACESWDNLRASSQKIWDWVKINQPTLAEVKTITGITGPGSFSSLRITGLITETLCEKYQCQLKTVRADLVAHQILSNHQIQKPFVLNAFGPNVFYAPSTDQELELIPVEAVSKRFDRLFTGFLPTEKQLLLPFKEDVSPTNKDVMEALYEVSKKQDPIQAFIPYYGHPGV